MLRASFSSLNTARAAVNVLEAYGYSAKQAGRDVFTDCPPLLAVPAIQKRVGLAEIERLELDGGLFAWRRDVRPASCANAREPRVAASA